MATTVICCDDHEIVRRGVRRLLSPGTEFALIGESASGAETLELVREKQPDILLLDLRLPDANGLDVLSLISLAGYPTRSLILSRTIEMTDVVYAYRLGAAGFAVKTMRMEELLLALREVSAGRRAFRVPRESLRFAADSIDLRGSQGLTISFRELQVLRCTGEGMRTGQIAEALRIHPRTVDEHRRTLRRKLGLPTFQAFVEYARARRIPPDVGLD